MATPADLTSENIREEVRALFPQDAEGYGSMRDDHPAPPLPLAPSGLETHSASARFGKGTLPHFLARCFLPAHPVWGMIGACIHADVFRNPEHHATTTGFALLKPGSSLNGPVRIRPIAVPSWARRIIARTLARRVLTAHPSLAPHQWGLEKAGCESIHNAVSSIVNAGPPNLSVVSLDIKNAYGTLPRSMILAAINALPTAVACELHAYAHHFLLSDTVIRFSGRASQPLDIKIQTGVPQGDPLSPVLFALAMQPILKRLESATVKTVAFLDDIALASTTLHSVNDVVAYAAPLLAPLTLNIAKCTRLDSSSSLLGASFNHTTISPSVMKATGRLYLLQECPAPQHILPAVRHTLAGTTYSARLGDPVHPASDALKSLLSHLTNLHTLNPLSPLTPGQITLASLPLARGGLGLPDPTLTAPHKRADCLDATFTSSSLIINHLTESLLAHPHPAHITTTLTNTHQAAVAHSMSLTGPPRARVPPPNRPGPLTGTHHHPPANTPRHVTHQRRIDHSVTQLATSDPALSAHITTNLYTDPSFLASTTQTLTPLAFMLALRTRLHIAEPWVPGTCPHCNSSFQQLTPHHLATCTTTYTTRHNLVRDLIASHAMSRLGTTQVKVEPTGLIPNSADRPADILMLPTTQDPTHFTAFDVTISTQDLETARIAKISTSNAEYLRAHHCRFVPIVFSPLARTEFHTTKALQAISYTPRGPGGILHDVFIVLFNHLASQYDARNIFANFSSFAAAVAASASAASPPTLIPPTQPPSAAATAAAIAATSIPLYSATSLPHLHTHTPPATVAALASAAASSSSSSSSSYYYYILLIRVH